MLRDCKYILPCAWCDKYDRPCLLVEYESAKQEQEKNSKQIAKNGGIIYESSDKWQL